MMRFTCLLLTLCLGTALGLRAGNEEEDAYADYKEVEYKVLTLTPEDFKNDKVTYVGTYAGFSTTFPKYIEDSGFSPSRYVGLGLTNLRIPAILKKSNNDDLLAILGTLKAGAQVQFYGKIRKFRQKPERTMLPEYYLELHHLEVIETSTKDKAKPGRGLGFGRR